MSPTRLPVCAAAMPRISARGKLSVEGFRRVIEQKDRCQAGTSVPGNALFLVDVAYPETTFLE